MARVGADAHTRNSASGPQNGLLDGSPARARPYRLSEAVGLSMAWLVPTQMSRQARWVGLWAAKADAPHRLMIEFAAVRSSWPAKAPTFAPSSIGSKNRKQTYIASSNAAAPPIAPR